MQPADECEIGCVLAAIVNFGQLILKIVDIRLETVGGSHLDGEEVMVILLEFLTGGISSEKQLDEASEVVD